MKNRIVTLALASLVAGTMLSSPLLAQETPADPGHPRISEVDQRLSNQQNRIDNGLKDGQITPAQATHDEQRDTKVQQQLSRDESKNGGHITKAEQKHMNKELNKNSRKIHHQRKLGQAAKTAQ